jgi:D-alanyl-D-alanine carboxypeptidase
MAADNLRAVILRVTIGGVEVVTAALGESMTGETIFDIRGDEWFLAASTTKLFTGAAALDACGRDTADGHIAFTPIDHINATAFPKLVT